MNPEHDTTFTTPADYSRLLSLLHDWLELNRAAQGIPNTAAGDKEYDAARERFDALTTEVIAPIPAAGAPGLAIKAFLYVQFLDPGNEFLRPLEISILEDAARLVPELAPLTAEMVAHAAEQDTGAEPRGAASDGLTEAERRLVETLSALKRRSTKQRLPESERGRRT